MPSYHDVTVTESESLSTEQLFLEIKFCENSIFTGELVGDALENKKSVLKEQRKEKQFDGLKDQFEEKSLHWVQLP